MKRVTILAAIVAICTLAIAPGADAATIAVNGIGGHLSLVNPDNVGTTVGIGFLMDMGFVGTAFGLESYAAYWSQSESAFGVEASFSDFIIGGRGKYNFAVSNPKVHPYAGAGLGLHFVTLGVDIPAINFGGTTIPGSSVEDSELRLGVDFGGGLMFDVSDRVSLMGDTWVTLVSDVSQLNVRFGALYRFQ